MKRLIRWLDGVAAVVVLAAVAGVFVGFWLDDYGIAAGMVALIAVAALWLASSALTWGRDAHRREAELLARLEDPRPRRLAYNQGYTDGYDDGAAGMGWYADGGKL